MPGSRKRITRSTTGAMSGKALKQQRNLNGTTPKKTKSTPLTAEDLATRSELNALDPNGYSVAFSFTENAEGLKSLAADKYHIAKLISKETFKHVVETGRYQGLSVVLMLSRNQQGIDILTADNLRLTQFIDKTVLNRIITTVPYAGLSLAFMLSRYPKGLDLLAADNFRLAKLIDKNTLNHIIAIGPYAGLSLAFMLSRHPKALDILAADNFRLAKLIDKNTFNHIIKTGPHAGQSVAFWLSEQALGIDMLALPVNPLAQHITPETLNHVLTQEHLKGMSVAFNLSNRPSGMRILEENKYQLAKQIQPTTLNTRLGDNTPYPGCSVAFSLSKHSHALAIFKVDNTFLVNDITSETLNYVLKHGRYAGQSLAFCLSQKPAGIDILDSLQKNDITITRDTLNHVIGADLYYRGHSVLLQLSMNKKGQALLAADGYRLAAGVKQEAFNSIVTGAEHTHASPALYLSGSAVGLNIIKKILTEHPSIQLDEKTLNHLDKLNISVALFLSRHPKGRKLLSQFDLEIKISEATRNAQVKDGRYAGQSVALHLGIHAESSTKEPPKREVILSTTDSALFSKTAPSKRPVRACRERSQHVIV